MSTQAVTGGTEVTITDKNGDHTFTVLNGQDAVIDATLSHQGEAADAKATGDAISQLNSAINDISINKADVIVSSASGAIASFPDGMAAPIKDMTINVDPVQDLHGYSNPWPAGGGKNKFKTDFENTTINGTAITKLSDGKVTTSGTPSSAFDFVIGHVALAAGTYILNGCPSGGGATKYRLQVTDYPVVNNLGQDSGSGVTFTLAQDMEVAVRIQVYTGAPASLTYAPMIRLSTESDDTFAPHENICPISGHTGCEVHVADGETPHVVDNTYPISWQTEAGTVYGGSLEIKEDGSGVLTVIGELESISTLENESVIGTSKFIDSFNKLSSIATVLGDVVRLNFTVGSATGYNRISSSYDYKMCNYLKHYFAYNDTTPHWYRNTVLYVFLPTSLAGTTSQSAFDYLVSIKDTNPLSFFIQYTTPLTYNLTAEQVGGIIRTLYGDNNIWSDTGDVSVNYRCDTKKYIDKKLAALVAALS